MLSEVHADAKHKARTHQTAVTRTIHNHTERKKHGEFNLPQQTKTHATSAHASSSAGEQLNCRSSRLRRCRPSKHNNKQQPEVGRRRREREKETNRQGKRADLNLRTRDNEEGTKRKERTIWCLLFATTHRARGQAAGD